MNFAVQPNHWLKKGKKRYVSRPCQRTKKKLWIMKVTVISVVTYSLGTIPKAC